MPPPTVRRRVPSSLAPLLPSFSSIDLSRLDSSPEPATNSSLQGLSFEATDLTSFGSVAAANGSSPLPAGASAAVPSTAALNAVEQKLKNERELTLAFSDWTSATVTEDGLVASVSCQEDDWLGLASRKRVVEKGGCDAALAASEDGFSSAGSPTASSATTFSVRGADFQGKPSEKNKCLEFLAKGAQGSVTCNEHFAFKRIVIPETVFHNPDCTQDYLGLSLLAELSYALCTVMLPPKEISPHIVRIEAVWYAKKALGIAMHRHSMSLMDVQNRFMSLPPKYVHLSPAFWDPTGTPPPEGPSPRSSTGVGGRFPNTMYSQKSFTELDRVTETTLSRERQRALELEDEEFASHHVNTDHGIDRWVGEGSNAPDKMRTSYNELTLLSTHSQNSDSMDSKLANHNQLGRSASGSYRTSANELIAFLKGLRRSTMPEELLCILAKDILCALVTLHEKMFLMHNDIKTDNILLSITKQTPGFILCDFGCALPVNRDGRVSSKHTRHATGNPEYRAPEAFSTFQQITDHSLQQDEGEDGPVDALFSTKSDIWGLGLLMLEMRKGARVGKICVNRDGLETPIQSWEECSGGCVAKPVDEQFGLVEVADTSELDALDSSDEFKDFVRKALTVEHASRPSAKELLRHPFLGKASTFRSHFNDYFKHLKHERVKYDTGLGRVPTGSAAGPQGVWKERLSSSAIPQGADVTSPNSTTSPSMSSSASPQSQSPQTSFSQTYT